MRPLKRNLSLLPPALMAFGMLVAGCGGGSPASGVASLGSSHSSKTSTSTASQGAGGSAGASGGGEPSPGSQAVAYASCMHTHGIPNFPEPQVSQHGNSTSIKMAVPAGVGQNPRFKAASEACRKLLPGGGPGNHAPLTPAQQEQYLKVAACIRSHGVPNFPDPTFSGGGVHIDRRGLDMSSPTFEAAVRACESLIPGGVHGNGG
jgi:hypothetical protein